MLQSNSVLRATFHDSKTLPLNAGSLVWKVYGQADESDSVYRDDCLQRTVLMLW